MLSSLFLVLLSHVRVVHLHSVALILRVILAHVQAVIGLINTLRLVIILHGEALVGYITRLDFEVLAGTCVIG